MFGGELWGVHPRAAEQRRKTAARYANLLNEETCWCLLQIGPPTTETFLPKTWMAICSTAGSRIVELAVEDCWQQSALQVWNQLAALPEYDLHWDVLYDSGLRAGSGLVITRTGCVGPAAHFPCVWTSRRWPPGLRSDHAVEMAAAADRDGGCCRHSPTHLPDRGRSGLHILAMVHAQRYAAAGTTAASHQHTVLRLQLPSAKSADCYGFGWAARIGCRL